MWLTLVHLCVESYGYNFYVARYDDQHVDLTYISHMVADIWST